MVSTNCEAPVYGGDSACLHAPAISDGVILPSPGLSLMGGAPAAVGEALPAVVQKRALRKMF